MRVVSYDDALFTSYYSEMFVFSAFVSVRVQTAYFEGENDVFDQRCNKGDQVL